MEKFDTYIQESVQDCGVCGDCSRFAYDDEYANFIIRYDYNLAGALNIIQPDCVRIISSQYAIGYKKITERLSMGKYGYNSFPKCYGLMDSTSIDAVNVGRIRNIPGLSLTGRNVICGIIDTGIDYENPLFRNLDGTTRILALWDQSIPGSASYDSYGRELNHVDGNGEAVSYVSGYGTVYTAEEINRALLTQNPEELVPSRDENGHGTFLSSIMAGGRDENNDFEGMAPDSLLAVVKLKQAKKNLRDFYGINPSADCYQEDDIMSGIRFLIDVADQENKPLVILLGLGTNQGDHRGNSYLEQYIDRLGNFIWIVVVDAAGNELTYGSHYQSRNPDNISGDIPYISGRSMEISQQGQSPEIVEISVGEGETGFTLEVWGEAPGHLSVGIESPTGQIYSDRTTNAVNLEAGVEIRFFYENTKVILEDILIEESSGNQVVILRFQNPAAGIWKLRIMQDSEIVNPYDIWLPVRAFLSSETRFLSPEPNITLCSPANSNLSITSAGYDHVNGSIYARSSRGYTRDGRKKPDITAPSVNVAGAWKSNIYTNMSGTSVGAAHLAGAAALILEWAVDRGNYPEINTRIVKQMIIRGARRESGESYPNRITGWGYLDLEGVFDALRL